MPDFLIRNRKISKAPFRLMVFITLFVIIINGGAYAFATLKPANLHVQRLQFNFLIVLWPVLLCAETITYRLIRQKIKSSFAIWMHIFSNLICFFLIPLAVVLINAFLTRRLGVWEYRTAILKLNQFRELVFWGLFVTGHAFFITIIVKILRKDDTTGVDNEQPPGILDGILDEY